MEYIETTVPRDDLRVTRTEAIPRWSMHLRLALGVWTFLMPIAASILGMYALQAHGHDTRLFAGEIYLFVCHVILCLFYLSFVAQNPRIPGKVTWMAAILFAGPVSIPVYWVIHVWEAPKVGLDDVDSVVPQHRARPAHATEHALT